mgnify:CR=1 FL=1
MIKNRKLIFICLALLFFINALIWQTVWSLGEKHLTVAIIDVGQGEAIFIKTPDGKQIMIDGGPNRQVLEALGKLMPFNDRTLDLLIVSNPDQDHLGGLVEILNRYQVGMMVEPGTVTKTKVFKRLKEVGEGVPLELTARGGLTLNLGGGVKLEILAPVANARSWSTNDGSIVARLVYGETEFMLTGDSTEKVERQLLATLPGEALGADVLKVGHHGSKTSTSQEFTEAVKPKFAVISSGKDNRYGHPHQKTLETLANAGVKTFRTDQLGTIIFESDGERIELK